MRKIHTKLTGTSRDNDDGTSRQAAIRKFCPAGKKLTLIREPQNKFDKNAVGVWVHGKTFLFGEHEYQAGYLSAELAADIAPLLDAGKQISAEVESTSGGTGDKPNLGLNIIITLQD